MTGEAIITVSAAVVTAVQFAKWSGINDKHGPLAVLVFSALGVGLWAFSVGTIARTEVFSYFAGWIAIATSAAGVYGFSRASASALIKAMPPPNSGAGSEATMKEP
jgi:hypothetical protein